MTAARSFSAGQAATLPPAVAEIGKIHFEGNIVPHSWYQRITLGSGKPDLPAIIILGEIVYWYRPYQTLSKGGRPILKKHFDGDMFQGGAAYFSSKFGFTKDQVRKALKRLEDAGYIRREYRYLVQQGILRNNVMFIEPVTRAIMALTHPGTIPEATSSGAAPLSPTGDTLSPTGDTLSPTGDFFIGIETTTEISTETTTTTPNPSSNKAAAETELARGGGIEDQNPTTQDGRQEPITLELTEQNPVSREGTPAGAAAEESDDTASENRNSVAGGEVGEGQRSKLAFPAKLTEREREDIAAQVHPLPPEIAQQMLDVVAAKIAAGQIKTNPAALLRGILRKRRQDPASFDPSVGFGIAAARCRHAESDARARAEARRRDLEREMSPITPAAREAAHRSLAAIKAMLRGHA